MSKIITGIGLGNIEEFVPKGGLGKGEVLVLAPPIGPPKTRFLEDIKMKAVIEKGGCMICDWLDTHTIPCECEVGRMRLVLESGDPDHGKYKCTSCGYTTNK